MLDLAPRRKNHREQLDVKVVVSGSAAQIWPFPHTEVCELVRAALAAHGIPHLDIAGWTLRAGDGAEVSNAARVGEAGITEGATMFLDPDMAGCGVDGWIEMGLRLCDDAGQVSHEQVVDDPPPVGGETYLERHERLSGRSAAEYPGGWTCTSHAHYRHGGYGPLHITCTSPAHGRRCNPTYSSLSNTPKCGTGYYPKAENSDA